MTAGAVGEAAGAVTSGLNTPVPIRLARTPQWIHRERLVAVCRIVFALVALGAEWLDPKLAALRWSSSLWLVAGYLACAIVFGAWVLRARAMPRHVPTMVHGVDLLVFSAWLFAAEGSPGLLFVFMVFILTAAAVRWRREGALWTTLVAMSAYLVAHLDFSGGMLPHIDEPGLFLANLVQLVMVGVLLAYLTDHDDRLHARASSLLGWPALRFADREELLRGLLGHAASVLGARAMVLAWEEHEEPWTLVATWSQDRVDVQRLSPEDVGPLVPDEWSARSFFIGEGQERAAGSRVVGVEGSGVCEVAPVPAWLHLRWSSAGLLSLPVQGETLTGRLFALDPADLSADELILGELLARQLALRLDQQAVFERLHLGALVDERVRIARDLHDGVIQSLAAASLRLESARQTLRSKPETAAHLVGEVQDLLLSEQRELREIVGTLMPSGESSGPGNQGFAQRMRTLVDRVSAYWGLEVELNNRLDEEAAASGRGHHVCCLVQEALVNASRHGRATRVGVTLESDVAELRVTVADNGRGFPFHGTLDDAAMLAAGLGPNSLRQRLLSLGGGLDIDSAEAGATVRMRFPRRRSGTHHPAFDAVTRAEPGTAWPPQPTTAKPTPAGTAVR